MKFRLAFLNISVLDWPTTVHWNLCQFLYGVVHGKKIFFFFGGGGGSCAVTNALLQIKYEVGCILRRTEM